MSDKQWVFDNHEEAADLIEQQQARIDELAATVERLLKACVLARDNYGKMLMTDPPQEAWKVNQVTEKLAEAIAATPQQNLAQREVEVLLELAEYMEKGFGMPMTMGCDDVREYAKTKYPSDKVL